MCLAELPWFLIHAHWEYSEVAEVQREAENSIPVKWFELIDMEDTNFGYLFPHLRNKVVVGKSTPEPQETKNDWPGWFPTKIFK